MYKCVANNYEDVPAKLILLLVESFGFDDVVTNKRYFGFKIFFWYFSKTASNNRRVQMVMTMLSQLM